MYHAATACNTTAGIGVDMAAAEGDRRQAGESRGYQGHGKDRIEMPQMREGEVLSFRAATSAGA